VQQLVSPVSRAVPAAEPRRAPDARAWQAPAQTLSRFQKTRPVDATILDAADETGVFIDNACRSGKRTGQLANRRVPKHQDFRSASRSPSRSPSCNLAGEIRPRLTISRDDHCEMPMAKTTHRKEINLDRIEHPLYTRHTCFAVSQVRITDRESQAAFNLRLPDPAPLGFAATQILRPWYESP